MKIIIFFISIIFSCPLIADDVQTSFYFEINQYRKALKLEMLYICTPLEIAALSHVNDMYSSGNFSHIGSDGSTFQKRAKISGHDKDPTGELILMGPRGKDMKNIISQLLKNYEAKRIALDTKIKCMGMGYHLNNSGNKGNYWCVLFSE